MCSGRSLSRRYKSEALSDGSLAGSLSTRSFERYWSPKSCKGETPSDGSLAGLFRYMSPGSSLMCLQVMEKDTTDDIGR